MRTYPSPFLLSGKYLGTGLLALAFSSVGASHEIVLAISSLLLALSLDRRSSKLGSAEPTQELPLLATLDLLPIGIIIAETKGSSTIYCNRTMNKIWSFSTNGEAGESSWSVYNKRGELMPRESWPIVRSTQRGETVSQEEITIYHHDGRREYFLISSAPMKNADGHIVAGIGLCQDITHQRLIQDEAAELRISEQSAKAASQIKSSFLTHMSHEIRTPINGVIGLSKLLDQTELDTEQREYCEGIKRSGSSLLTLINDILDFSKIEANQLDFEKRDFELALAIQETCLAHQSSLAAKGLLLTQQLDPILPVHARGDRQRLSQVLGHILSNAAKFSERGEIVLRVKLVDQHAESFKLLFEVEDSGIGIPSEKKEMLFKAFSQVDSRTTRQHGGTGLGLSISQYLVHRMGGDIGCDSQPGLGSRFWFTVQLEICPGQDSAHLATMENFSPAAFTILVVEDVELNRVITLKMLQKMGYRTHAVSNGREALIALQNQSFDLVLMDCLMPEMDGYTATEAIRRSSGISPIPIIAMTANVMRGDREKCLEVGMNDYLGKPFRPQQLDDLLRKWLSSFRADSRTPARVEDAC